MSKTYKINGLLTSYYGNSGTLYRSPDGRGGTHSFTLNDVTYTGYFSGFRASDNYRYGTLCEFDVSDSIISDRIQSLSVTISRDHICYTNSTYAVAGYSSVPTELIEGTMRTGNSEITTNRSSINFSGTPDASTDGEQTFDIELSKFDYLKDNGFVMFPRSSGSLYRHAKIKSAFLTIVTNESDFVLKYSANGGSGAPSDQNGIGVNTCDFIVSSTVPTRDNYEFLGWSASQTATSATYSAGDTISCSTLSTTLYAVWELKVGTINFNSNGGSTAPSAITGLIGTTISIPTTVLTKSGFTFVGWNTNSAGTGTTYLPGATYSISTEAVTLYAYYTENTRTVTYNLNGGEGDIDQQTAPLSQSIIISAEIPSRVGYLFSGWSTSASSTTVSYNPGSTYSGTADLNLYAVWVLADYSVFVTDGEAWHNAANIYHYDGNEWRPNVVPCIAGHDGTFKSTKL